MLTLAFVFVVACVLPLLACAFALVAELTDGPRSLHPGIEAWLAEHGNLIDWEKEWGPIPSGVSEILDVSFCFLGRG